MKFSKQWLSEYLSLPATDVLVETLTMAGLEVDAVELAAPEFSGVVVGEIMSIEQHPDADKLRVCQVKGSADELVQVVCGAANARQGIKIPFAQVGAKLPGDFKIKKAKLRGVESFGMLCGADEIGVGEKSDGLLELQSDAPTGQDFREYMQLNDECLELDLTPNRGDCLGLLGLARETSTLTDTDFNFPMASEQAASIAASKQVQLNAPADCPRYASRIIKGIDVTQASPMWLQEKLRRSGVRSIDAVVDITNLVLLELGQPMHAFDLEKVQGDIQVRFAQANEKLELLDGQTLELKNKELVIADDTQALALAGIMGGQLSSVQSGTQDILLEAAYFDPTLIAGRARSLGLHTDSSHRFERGVDFQLPAQAIERATELLLEIVGGQAGPVVIAEAQDHLPALKQVELKRTQIKRLLGLDLADDQVENILSRLGFVLESQTQGWTVKVPSWRFDVSIEADLLEELARVYGYSELPVRALPMDAHLQSVKEELRDASAVEQILVQRGYQEVICYSFIDELRQQQVNPDITPVPVKNPISKEMAVMRTSLLPGLLQTLDHNLKRQQSRVRIFEQGLSFVPQADGELNQVKRIAGLIAGNRYAENWTTEQKAVDFFDIKADVEQLTSSANVSFVAAEHHAMHPGQCAQVFDEQGNSVGFVGAIHPKIKQDLGLSVDVMMFELDYAALVSRALPQFNAVSKYPEVRRDLAFIVDQHIPVADIAQSIKESAGDSLRSLILFDNYKGKGVDSSSKSVAFGLIFCKSDTTLKDEEVNKTLEIVIETIKTKHGASLRD